jgi:chitodextrinase
MSKFEKLRRRISVLLASALLLVMSLPVHTVLGAENPSVPAAVEAAVQSGLAVGDPFTYNGVNYVTKLVKSWDFSTNGSPWALPNNTWDGYNGGWEANPFNGGNSALTLTLNSAVNSGKLAKTHVGSLGLTANELALFAGRQGTLVRLEYKLWQEGGFGSGQGTRLNWSTKASSGEKYTDDSLIRDARNGVVEAVYYAGTNARFASSNGTALVTDLRLALQVLNNDSKKASGTKVYVDDIVLTVFQDAASAQPSAPSQPVVNDSADFFGWTDVPEYPGAGNYEFSVDNGVTWRNATANPQPVGNINASVGAVKVRVKADAAAGRPAGQELASDKVFTLTGSQQPEPVPGTLLWQLGVKNGVSAELAGFNGPSAVTVPADWSTRGDWTILPKGLKLDQTGSLDITYSLSEVPEHGIELSTFVLDAYTSIPQMAVFSNGQMAGLVQITGVNGSGSESKFKQTYRLYIPKEMLQTGENHLLLKADRGLYADSSGDSYIWWEWDYIRLEALNAPALEPVHGRVTHLGTTLSNGFDYNENAVRLLPQLTKWIGSAYSGNMYRTSFWSDTQSQYSANGRNYLTTLKDLNITPLMDIFGGNIMRSQDMLNGSITPSVRQHYLDFVQKYGDLFEYLEVDNEPGLFGSSLVGNIALAQMLNDYRPVYNPNLKIVAPGWAYWPSKGIPDGWERNPEYRRQVEDLTDFTNGHSYGGTGVTQARGGALLETLLTHPESADGLSKPMIMSENGANDGHADNSKYGTWPNRYEASFDREIRAALGYTDYSIQHAAFFNTYSLFQDDINWNTHRVENTKAHVNTNDPGGESRLSIFRRLTAAYSTHGKPLSYEVLNASALADKKAYFRAVDTSSLGVTNLGASSDKILLNFVNFETSPVTMNVQVQMPQAALYTGERFGAGDTYALAYSRLAGLNALPELTLQETLQPGETVQYILTVKETEAPSAPVLTAAAPASYTQVNLTWMPAADNRKVAFYQVYKDNVLYQTTPASMTTMEVKGLASAATFSFTVQAVDESGNLSPMSNALSAATPAIPVTDCTFDAASGSIKCEAEKGIKSGSANEQNDSAASGGKLVGNLHGGALTISQVDGRTAGSVSKPYILTIRYANGEASSSTKSLFVNDVKQEQLVFPSTGGWSGSGKYQEIVTNVTLNNGPNDIRIAQVSGDSGGINMDYILLVPGVYQKDQWRSIQDDSPFIYYSSPTFALDAGNERHESNNPGDFASLTFRGSGVKWFSHIKSDLGKADIYIDGELVETVDLVNAGLEGYDKEVFSIEGLEYGYHTIRIQVKEGMIGLYKLQYFGEANAAAVPGPDLIVTDVSWTPASPAVGDQVVFSAVVKNIGPLPTPDQIVTGGIFVANGATVNWTDTYKNAIQSGESVTLTVTGSSSGSLVWSAPQAGSYQIKFQVNDINRYSEMTKTNNTLTKILIVTEQGTEEPGTALLEE